jgi:hypothetical protein
MKLISFITTVVLAAFSVNASAVLMSTAGSLDTLLAQTTLSNSGSSNEEAWIESVLGIDITYSQLSGSGASAWEAVTDGSSGDYAYDFGTGVEPEYFLVKVGGGGGTGTSDTHFLFDNNNFKQWAYVNLVQFGSGVSLTNIGIISHVGATGGGGEVPEPGPLALLAIGMLGIGMRQFKKAR